MLVPRDVEHVFSSVIRERGDRAARLRCWTVRDRGQVLVDPVWVVEIQLVDVLITCDVEDVLSVAIRERGHTCPSRRRGWTLCHRGEVLVGPVWMVEVQLVDVLV